MDIVSWHLPRGIVSTILGGMMAAWSRLEVEGSANRGSRFVGGIDLGLKARSLIPQNTRPPSLGRTLVPGLLEEEVRT